MSANNYILIKKAKDKYIVKDKDMDIETTIEKVGEYKTLEEAIKAANKYQENNEVEYGLSIKV